MLIEKISMETNNNQYKPYNDEADIILNLISIGNGIILNKKKKIEYEKYVKSNSEIEFTIRFLKTLGTSKNFSNTTPHHLNGHINIKNIINIGQSISDVIKLIEENKHLIDISKLENVNKIYSELTYPYNDFITITLDDILENMDTEFFEIAKPDIDEYLTGKHKKGKIRKLLDVFQRQRIDISNYYAKNNIKMEIN
jgi:hypothetical protein